MAALKESAEVPNPLECPEPSNQMEWYTTVSHEPFHSELYKQAFQILLDALNFSNKDAIPPPILFKSKEELQKLFYFTLGSHRSSHEALIEALKNIVRFSPLPFHPQFLGKHQAGLDHLGLIGDIMSTVMYSNIMSYLFAPVSTLQEEELKKAIRTLIQYPSPEEGDGSVSSDPATATMIALKCAMQAKYPEIREKGFASCSKDIPYLCVVASECSAPYLKRVCAVCGLGTEAFVTVKVDKNGKMIVAELKATLEKLRKQKKQPIMIVGNIGSDPFGTIDPIQDLGKICNENGIWFHVDGQFGGSLVFSEVARKSGKLAGLEMSDSFTLGTTAMLGTPYSTSVIVTKKSGILSEAIGIAGFITYLYQKNPLYDSKVDNGDRSLQTCRRAEATSLWMMWKVKGSRGLGQQVDKMMVLAKKFNEVIGKRENFYSLVEAPETTKVLFYYKSATTTRQLQRCLMASGGPYLGLTTLPGAGECFAVNIANPSVTLGQLTQILNQIEAAAIKIESATSPTKTPLDSAQKLIDPFTTQQLSLVQRVLQLVQDRAIFYQSRRQEPVLKFRQPEQLCHDLNLSLGEDPGLKSEDEILNQLEKMIDFSVHTPHPLYMFHLPSTGADAYSFWFP